MQLLKNAIMNRLAKKPKQLLTALLKTLTKKQKGKVKAFSIPLISKLKHLQKA